MTRTTQRAGSGFSEAAIPRNLDAMPYVLVTPSGRYFMTEDGSPFLVIGHNDAMPWPLMHNLRSEEGIAVTEGYIKDLVEHGVTVMRIMLEYAQDGHWYFEKPAGKPVPEMVLYWDNLIGLCERHGLRLLVLFWDTFFMSRRWKQHPYGKVGAGLEGPQSMCTSPRAMELEKSRIAFFIDRWGNSPAIFSYDLLNEIHPYWGGTPEDQARWVGEIARFVKERELERWGKRHLLTVSHYGHEPDAGYAELLFRHSELDFATTHVYQAGPSNDMADAVAGAALMEDAVQFAYREISGSRPYMDTESGPIFSFMHTRKRPTEEFETEYYHNMSWAHLASGGAGSGMRWPFRNPHTLSPAMHDVMQGMSRVVKGCNLDWPNFSPEPVRDRCKLINQGGGEAAEGTRIFGCADRKSALLWLLRDGETTVDASSQPAVELYVTGLAKGMYSVEVWETYGGSRLLSLLVEVAEVGLSVPLQPFGRDAAITITLT